MPSLTQIFFIAPALLAVAHSQGVILSAQGTKGSPASPGLQVQTTGSDANIINEAEISANVVNECGRTLLAGNIDIGANTEDQLANKTVTSVTKGSTVTVNIDQVSADGAGPYTCDLDPTGNAEGADGQTALTVKETDSSSGTGNITLAVTMPSDLACAGSSTGNVCTVRCFNSAAAGPFGGCFAVQQTDVTAGVNSADTITTAQTLDGILTQVAENQIDLPGAVKAMADATTQDEQGVLAVSDILAINPIASTAVAVPGAGDVQATATAAATAATTTTATAKSGKNGNGKTGQNAKTGPNAKAGRRSRVFIS